MKVNTYAGIFYIQWWLNIKKKKLRVTQCVTAKDEPMEAKPFVIQHCTEENSQYTECKRREQIPNMRRRKNWWIPTHRIHNTGIHCNETVTTLQLYVHMETFVNSL